MGGRLGFAFGLWLGCGVALAAPVGSALDRQAVMARQPERSVLLGAAMAGGRMVAVGERGSVLLSDDGANWRQAAVPVSVTLTAVRFVDAKQGYAVGHGGVVLATRDGGASWVKRFDGVRAAALALQAAKDGSDARAIKDAERLVADGADKPFLDLHFFDALHGIVVGAYGLAFATEDGGQTWTPWLARLDNPKGLHLYAVRARGDRIVMAGEQGLLLVSEDAGRHFNRLDTPYKGSFFTLELPAEGEIVLAGLRGNVWRSTDAGAHWAQVPLPMPVSITGSALRPDGSLVLVNQAGVVLAGRDGVYLPLKLPASAPLNGVMARADGSLLALGVQGVQLLPAGAPQ